MARPLRILAGGLTYHVYARGNARMAIYLDDFDRQKFLDLFSDVVCHFDIECPAYCMMKNHYHAVLTTRDANLSRAMKALNGPYAQWWNQRHERVGHVFQGRFGAKVVQNDTYLLTVCKYIVRNPLRENLVQSPGEWAWSSYRATAGLEPVPPFLKPDPLWRMLGDSEGRRAALRYQDFVAMPGDEAIDNSCAIAIGDAEFVRRVDGLRRHTACRARNRGSEPLPPLDRLFAGAVTRAARNARLVSAARIGHSRAAIARFLGMDVSSVNKIVAATERAGLPSVASIDQTQVLV